MAVTTLHDLMVLVAHAYGGYRAGTSTALGTTTTLVDSGLVDQDAHELVNHVIEIGGVARRVSKVDACTGVLTFCPALGAAVASGTAYEVWPVTKKTVQMAVNSAVRAAGPAFVAAKMNASLTVNWTAGEVVLPEDCVVVTALELRRTDQVQAEWVPVTDYTVMNDNGQRVAKLNNVQFDLSLNVNTTSARVHYFALPFLESVIDEIGVGSTVPDYETDQRKLMAYVERKAVSYLDDLWLRQHPNHDGARTRQTLMTKAMQEADQLKALARAPHAMRTVRRQSAGEVI